MMQPLEVLEHFDAALHWGHIKSALKRNPPKKAIEMLVRWDELHREMDELDLTQSTIVKIKATKTTQ
jgi:hypothetical protein